MDFTAKKMLPKDWQKIVEELLIHQQSSNVRKASHDKELTRLMNGLKDNETYQKQCEIDEQTLRAKNAQIVAKVRVGGPVNYYYEKTTGFWYSETVVAEAGIRVSPEIFDCGNVSNSDNRGGNCFPDKNNMHLKNRFGVDPGVRDQCVAMGCKHRALGSPQTQFITKSKF